MDSRPADFKSAASAISPPPREHIVNGFGALSNDIHRRDAETAEKETTKTQRHQAQKFIAFSFVPSCLCGRSFQPLCALCGSAVKREFDILAESVYARGHDSDSELA